MKLLSGDKKGEKSKKRRRNGEYRGCGKIEIIKKEGRKRMGVLLS